MMAEEPPISMIEIQLKSFIESLRPEEEEILKQLDFGYSWDGQYAFLYEIRPQWDNPTKIRHHEFAKLRFIKSSKIWKLYWLRGSGKWESYKPVPDSKILQKLLEEISNDKFGCFFG